MSEETLIVLLEGREIGQVLKDLRGRLTFRYSDEWRTLRSAYPLSLSMPLAIAEHGHDRIETFLWGLLPDNVLVLERWGQRFQVSARNAFALISQVGEDCACAFQFVRPDRLEALLEPHAQEIDWLSESQVAERLGELRTNHAAGRRLGDQGQFSLSGAQPKTAFYYEDGRWGIPSGRWPTTHILKPPTGDLDGFAENEHFCLALARTVGLPTTSSELIRFGDEVAIVIERFDRVWTAKLASSAAAEAAAWATAPDPFVAATKASAASARAAALRDLAEVQPILRLHQEDLCQALGISPTSKYQNQGGPSPEQIVELLRRHSSRPVEDVATFIEALAFNWLIAGTDAHAKNYALLHGSGGRVRLAPLYDIVSALPYPELEFERLKLAMKIGRKYRVRDIGPHQWQKLAEGLRLDPDETVRRISDLARRMIDSLDTVRAEAARGGMTHSIIDRLVELLQRRGRTVARWA